MDEPKTITPMKTGGQYLLNKGSHCYHIRGYCCEGAGKAAGLLHFLHETDLKSYEPRAFICETCQSKREERERKEIK